MIGLAFLLLGRLWAIRVLQYVYSMHAIYSIWNMHSLWGMYGMMAYTYVVRSFCAECKECTV